MMKKMIVTIRENDSWLSKWAGIGFLVLLCAPWFMPSNKLYHQLIIALLWLPAFLFLLMGKNRSLLLSSEMGLYVALAIWTILVIVIKGGEEPVSDFKQVFYVSLTLIAMLLVSELGEKKVKNLLLVAALVGGLGAGASWVSFYLFKDNVFAGRVMALGIWNTIIMAAHAVGALAVLGVGLVIERVRDRRVLCLAILAAIGYLLFLVSSQTRGVWVGLAAAMCVTLLVLPARLRWLLVSVGVCVISITFAVYPDFLLQRGLSYRPELWSGGVDLLIDSPWLGLGFHDIQLRVQELQTVFKHPHNLYINIALRTGIIGLALYLVLWGRIVWLAWQAREQVMGRALLGLWAFSTVCLLTDGIGLWDKPNADWLVIWLPVGLGLVLARTLKTESASV